MNSILKIAIISTLSLSLFASCTMQKRRYSSGYHVTWKHLKNEKLTYSSSKKTKAIKSSNLLDLHAKEEINVAHFSSRYPKSEFSLATIEHPKLNHQLNKDVANKIPFEQPILDTQMVLTTTEIEDNYFINSRGAKKKYRRGLKNALIFGGLTIGLIFGGIAVIGILAIGAFITGLALPKPNKNSLIASNSQLVKSQNDNKALAAAGIGAGLVVLIVIIGMIILIGLMFAV